MQVGPPEPLMPISLAGYVCTSQPAARSRPAAVSGIAVGDDDDARGDGQDIAAERRELGVGDRQEPDPQLVQELVQPDRQQGQDRRRPGRPRPVR